MKRIARFITVIRVCPNLWKILDEEGIKPMDQLHPVVQELLKLVPPLGTSWPDNERQLWLDTLRLTLRILYGDSDKVM